MSKLVLMFDNFDGDLHSFRDQEKLNRMVEERVPNFTGNILDTHVALVVRFPNTGETLLLLLLPRDPYKEKLTELKQRDPSFGFAEEVVLP